MLDKETIEKLKQPLDPSRVKHRQGGGGMSLAYLKGHNVIDQANELFGYGCWGYDILMVEHFNVLGESGDIQGGYYAARVKLTVQGCIPITEEGVCPIQEGRNPRAKIDAHDMARKGAVTDAMKRALRCYGDQFGNSLYDTDLVDGQPGTEKTTVTLRQDRPTQPTKAPVTQSRPQTVNNTTPATNGPRTAPAPTPTPDYTPAPEKVTEKEIKAIRELAGVKGVDEIALATKCVKLFKRPVEDLELDEARNFYRQLQQI